MHMPVLDGLEATRQIVQKYKGAGPIIIALTANTMADSVDQCLRAGMRDYLSKPLEIEKLAAILNKWGGNDSRMQNSSLKPCHVE